MSTTRVTSLFDIEFPIFAFSHCRDVVAAVSRAGGMGVLGALAYTPDELEIELSWIDDHCDGKPYGVDLVMPDNYIGKGGGAQATEDALRAMIPPEHAAFVDRVLDEAGIPPLPDDFDQQRARAAGLDVDAFAPGQVEVALKHPTRLLVNALGPPPKDVVDTAHDHGVLVAALVGARRHAERQVAQGVDIIVAQGGEAGGHTGDVATMVLVPEVRDAVGPDVPVLAAGGIGNGRQMAAAIALGADGVWTGSIWLTVAESSTQPHVVENLLAATSRDTVRSRSMTGKPARQLRTAWTEAWERDDSPGTLPMPLQGLLFNQAARRFSRVQDPRFGGSPVGQVVGQMNAVRPAKDVVFDMVSEWIDTVEQMSTMVRQPEG
jgi:NAD(P)H-dependent flavin oxidoreductase YrpB (nitropropane dioxygenase family)